MSTYVLSQELIENARPINGLTVKEILQRIRRDGAEICGLGVANRPLLDILPALGATRITVRDRRPPSPELTDTIARLGGRLIVGDGWLGGLSHGVIFRTPSLRPDVPALVEARRRGAVVLSEVALFLALCPARLYTVTGSDGKTTTAMMTAAMLRTAGQRVYLGGNIGTPLLSALPEMTAEDAAVLELSSFQLSDLIPPRGRSAITNITENHLDWHADMQEYVAAKARILGGGVAVLNADCPPVAALAPLGDCLLFSPTQRPRGDLPFLFCEGGEVKLYDSRVMRLFPLSAVRLPGRYQLENAMAAAGLTLDAVPPEAMEEALRGFRGPRHRREYIGRFLGVDCYDSSIDTTPARTAATLSSFGGRVVLLLGGRGKRVSLEPLAAAIAAHAAGVVATGEEAPAIAEVLGALCPAVPLVRVDGFREAVMTALGMAKDCGVLLLSPACTSFDAFPNYEARGDAFRAICQATRVEM